MHEKNTDKQTANVIEKENGTRERERERERECWFRRNMESEKVFNVESLLLQSL